MIPRLFTPARLFVAAMVVWPVAAVFPLGAQTGFPFSDDEALQYTVNWPSGISLGDVTLTAHRTKEGWNFAATLDASVPGFTLSDRYRSKVETNDLCSTEFERDVTHGGKHTVDKTTFDQQNGTAHRVTVLPEGGGKTDYSIGSCAHDALAYVYLTRREMGQGRMPAAQQVYFGSAYSVTPQYTGEETITSLGTGRKPAVTDKVVIAVKGPQSDFQFEMYFARDPQRTPLSIRVPTSLGTIALELAR